MPLSTEAMRLYMRDRRARQRESLPLTLAERVEYLEYKVEELEERLSVANAPESLKETGGKREDGEP